MNEQRNNGEFHRADPAWRRRMQVLVVLTAVLGLGAVAWLHRWLGGIRGGPAELQQQLGSVLGGLCLVLALVAFVFGFWLYRLAAATRAERRWPPGSMRTSADVRIRYLTSADALVTQMKAGAFGLGLLSAGLAAWGIWLLR